MQKIQTYFFILIFLLLRISNVSLAQTSIDSTESEKLQDQLKHLNDDISKRPISINRKVEEILAYAKTKNYGECIVIANTILAKGHEKQGNYDKALELIFKADSLTNIYNFHKYDFLIKFTIGMIYSTRGDSKTAIKHLEESLAIGKEIDNYKAIGSSFVHLGYAHTMLGNFEKATEYFSNAFDVYKTNKDEKRLSKCHLYLGILHNRMREPKKAIDEFNTAIHISTEEKDTAQMIAILQNLMSTHAILGNTDQAFELYSKRGELIEKIEYPENKKLDLNIGVMYIQDEQYQKGKDLLEICREYYKKEGNLYRIALIDHWIAIAFRGLNQYNKSAEKSIISYEEAKASGHARQAEISAYTLFQTYHWRGKNDLAIDWLQKANVLKDSLQTAKSEQAFLALQTKFDTYKKEQEIELLKSKRENDRSKRNILYLLLFLGSLLALALLYAQRQRAKKDKIHQLNLLYQSETERKMLQQKLEYKQKELTSQILTMTQKNTVLQNVRDRIQDLKTSENAYQVSRLIRNINQGINNSDEWEKFLATFKSIHSSFLEKLHALSDGLTSSEIRLASLMKMNLSSKEIASILNISDEGVKKARYRLRKKLGLASEVVIQDYLLSL